MDIIQRSNPNPDSVIASDIVIDAMLERTSGFFADEDNRLFARDCLMSFIQKHMKVRLSINIKDALLQGVYHESSASSIRTALCRHLIRCVDKKLLNQRLVKDMIEKGKFSGKLVKAPTMMTIRHIYATQLVQWWADMESTKWMADSVMKKNRTEFLSWLANKIGTSIGSLERHYIALPAFPARPEDGAGTATAIEFSVGETVRIGEPVVSRRKRRSTPMGTSVLKESHVRGLNESGAPVVSRRKRRS